MYFNQLELNFDISQSPGIERHRIVIAYDTPCNKRRRKLARAALSYATRVQQSVYEAELTEAQLRVFARTLTSISDDELDDIRLYPQCTRCADLRQFLGRARPAAQPLLVVA